jgi:hypothetical protein
MLDNNLFKLNINTKDITPFKHDKQDIHVYSAEELSIPSSV